MKVCTIIRSIAFVVIAIVSFVFANNIGDKIDGDFVSSSRYGGDAYTGIQNAAAETGTNVYRLNAIVKQGFEYTFIIVGLGFLVVGLTPALQTKKEDSTAETEQEISA